MSWTTSTTDLRTHLSDGPTDKYRFRKRLFGECNGSNKLFKTFEFRRVTNFTSASVPLGVFKNGALVAGATITSDYPNSGELILSTAPVDGDYLEASYYIQWFLDSELSEFILKSINWLGLGTDPNNCPDGLNPSALHFAASEAYIKMAMRWREHMSEMYRVEDAPDPKQKGIANEYMQMAETFYKKAEEFRNHYYTRQGQNLQPLYGVASGCVRDVTPKR